MELKLGYLTIKVRIVKDLNHCGEPAEGLWFPDKDEIHITEGLPDGEFFDTLLHECLHAISDIYGLDLEHSAIYTIAVGLTQMLGEKVKRK